MTGPVAALLPGDRLHLQHGPIDLIIGADGPARAQAFAGAAARFDGLLEELVAELPLLRAQVTPDLPAPQGPVARRMHHAVLPHTDAFITCMAAVAGSVADEILSAMAKAGPLSRAYVNNGGDIALHLAPGQSARVGLVADLSRFDADALARTVTGNLRTDAGFSVAHASPVRGVATSGWRGRSQSLGIADSVTVLAATAADADAAATVVANAVNLDDARIQRAPASSLRDDSDLGERLVTVAVPLLPPAVVQRALDAGLQVARHLQAGGCIHAALLVCQGSLARLAPLGALELV